MIPGLALMVRARDKYPTSFITKKLGLCAESQRGCDRCLHESRCRGLHDLRVSHLDIRCPKCGRVVAKIEACPWCNTSFKGLRAIRQEIHHYLKKENHGNRKVNRRTS